MGRCGLWLIGTIGVIVACHPSHGGERYPGKTWERRTPAQAGMDPARLKAFSGYTGGFGCVVRHGCMVYTWGDHTRRADVASACKPWFSHFLFKAVEDGRIKSVDEPVSQWEPRLRGINAKLGHKDRGITWRHFANQTSCYQLVEKPGTAYAYNDWQMALFWDTLFLKVYGATYQTVDAKVLRAMLTDPLQCEDTPTMMAFGTRDRPGRVAVSPRDFCRFGLLYLRGGRWKGKQLISAEHARMAVTGPLPNSTPRAGRRAAEMIPGQRTLGSRARPDNQTGHMGSYSWLWWTNGVDRKGKRHWPDAPRDAYGAFGHGGIRAMVVVPSLDLIVSWNGSRTRGADKENHALKLLVESVMDKTPSIGKPLPGQIIAGPNNPAWLVRYDPKGRHKPFFMCGPGDPEGFLYRGKRRPDGTRDGDQPALIRKLAPTGANCIYLMAVRSHGGDGDRTHNPFVDNDPKKGLNTKLLDQWDEWFAAMDNAGIVIYFFLYDDSARIWNTGDRVGPDEKAFIRGLVGRFKKHKRLIWCVAEEYQERFTAKRVSNIAAEIRKADEHHHPIAVHKLSGLSFKEFAGDPNIGQFAIQHNVSSPENLHAGIVRAFADAKGRYSLNMSEAANHGTGRTARLKNWAAAMAGAHVMVLGMDVANTPRKDLEDCGRVVRFFESADFTAMAPHDELAAADTQYVLAEPGRSYVAYSSRAGRVGLKKLTAGTYDLAWFDCVTGRTVKQRGAGVAAGDGAAGEHSWPPPAGFGKEAVVYVRRTK